MAGLQLVLCCVIGVIAAAPSNSTTSASYDTIVVGLGSAGVTAATTLARAGRRVLGLEAQDRVGGRVYTVPFGNGLVELGAEWIHGTEKSRTYDLANEYNISLLPTPLNAKIYRSNGLEANATLVKELFDYCLAVVGEQPPNPPEAVGNFTMRKTMEYITEKYPELLKDQDFIDQFFELADLYVDGYESSNDWNEVTTDSQYEELNGSQVISWHRYGYKTFFEIMLNKYDGGPGLPTLEIKLGKEVAQIIAPQHPNEKVVVKCIDGSSYEADNVIVTVSIGVLKAKYTTLFSPPLPKNKQTAIEKISIGVIDKVILAFDQIWWPNDHYYSFFGFLWKGEDRRKVSQDDSWMLNISGASPPMAASNVLTMWINGNAARKMETLPEDVVKTKCLELLQRFIGDNIGLKVPEPTALIRSTWGKNPFTRGSYTFDNLVKPQYPEARAWLGAPLTDSAGAPRVLFAGEATNFNHFSTVHGASETGYREAMRLLNSDTSVTA